MRLRVLVLLIAALLAFVACGGGSSGSKKTRVRLDLAWAERSRAVSGPSSALSVRVRLTGAQTDGSDLEFLVNRRADPAPYDQTVVATDASKPGTYPLSVTFYAGADGGGDTVGVASANVTIQKNGMGIGTISVASRVATVEVIPPSPLTVGSSTQLAFTARDANGAIVALTPGSAFWSLASPSTSITLARDGVAQAVQAGYANVRATVDGISATAVRLQIDNDPNGATSVLRFDDLPSTSVNAGTPVAVDARLSNRYLPTLGVVFSSSAGYVAVVQGQPGEEPSGPNAISGTTSDGRVSYDAANPIVVTFFDPKNPTATAGTKSFSGTTDRIGLPGQTVTLTAYDVADNVVATTTAPDSGGVVMTVESATPNIHRVVFSSSMGPSGGVSMDDVTFRPAVPLP